MRISGFEHIGHITSFRLEKACGDHSVCTFIAAIRVGDEERCLGRAGQPLRVFWDMEEEERCLFSGKVEDVHIAKRLHTATVEVRALSLSAEEDTPHTRLWQSPKKKIGDVLAGGKLALTACELRLSKDLEALPYGLPILQDQESNFSFLQRMADYVGMPLWVEDTRSDKCAIVLSKFLSDRVHEIKDEEILRYAAAQGRTGERHLTLTLKNYLPFGAKVKLSPASDAYVICALQVALVHEIYEFCYALQPYVPWQYTSPPLPRRAKTVYLKGTVENNRDEQHQGRLQVSFQDADVQDMDKERMWIPYQSPYTGLSGGIVFLPDVGDKVNVVFTNEGMYATAARRENPLAEECQKVEEKYIGNNTGQRVFFREKELKIASHDYSVMLDDEKIALTAGESKITLTKETILLRQGTTELLLDGKGIYVKAGGNEMAWNEQGIIGRSRHAINLTTNGSVDISGGGGIAIDAKGAPLSLNGAVVNIG